MSPQLTNANSPNEAPFSAAGISDHELVVQDLSVSLNICGQPHRIGCFAYQEDNQFKVAFRPILRTAKNFEIASRLDRESEELNLIINAQYASVQEFNTAVKDWAAKALARHELPEILMLPSQILNPGVPAKQQTEQPDSCKQLATFPLEPVDNYLERMHAIGVKLRQVAPSDSRIFMLQEVFVDNAAQASAGLEALLNAMGTSKFDYVLPTLPSSGFSNSAVTLFDRNTLSQVSDNEEVDQLADLIRANLLAAFNMNDLAKCNVVAFREKQSKGLKFVANIHADYAVNPVVGPYRKIGVLLECVPGLVVGGDFNLQYAFKDLMDVTTEGNFGFSKTVISTPETINPTFDAIFSSPGVVTHAKLATILGSLESQFGSSS